MRTEKFTASEFDPYEEKVDAECMELFANGSFVTYVILSVTQLRKCLPICWDG